MINFEELGKKLNSVKDAALQKGKEYTEIAKSKTKEYTDYAKLKIQMVEEDKKQNELFVQLGKRYVELHLDDAEEALAEMVAAYKASAAAKEELQAAIDKLKEDKPEEIVDEEIAPVKEVVEEAAEAVAEAAETVVEEVTEEKAD